MPGCTGFAAGKPPVVDAMQPKQHFSLPLSRGLFVSLTAVIPLSFYACSPGSDVAPSVTVEQEDPDGGGGSGGSGPQRPPRGLTPTEQMLYEQPAPPGCGDFEVQDDEACDDGNRSDLDGCSGNCLVVEPGYECLEPGTPCTLVEVCGDTRLVGAETCDDGNEVAGDGCAANCRLEAGFACPVPGEPCVSTAICGDGFVALGETCDDGNVAAGDGCSETCQLESGYQCLIANAKCTPRCGDGLIVGNERCDDGNTDPGDGCSASCRLEANSVCSTPGQACAPTTCGERGREGTEQCDDGNDLPYDGCNSCVNEPTCGANGAGVYACQAVCGDGMKFPEEACDDGNTDPDDGCSSTCELEPGYRCTNAAAELGDVLTLPIVIRDFSAAHPHFEIDPTVDTRLPGIVLPQLSGSPSKPVYNPAYSFNDRAWTMDGPGQAANGGATLNAAQIAARFREWYTDVPDTNFTFVQDLPLALINAEPGNETFQFAASGGSDNPFFPIDGLGFGNEGNPTNFHFTSEVRQWFEFQGGELLEFSGDDDVWVFVNGQLTVDLGGIHSELRGSIELGQSLEDPAELCVQDTLNGPFNCSPITVPLSPNVNEIVVFQAERHITQSNYTLTLRGFNAPITSCESVCGDGIVTPDETCDEGQANGTGYERCGTDCRPGPRCGDGNLDPEEQCDNGSNIDAYAISSGACAPGCVLPSSCGDGVIDAAYREQCDDGVNDSSYNGCTDECLLGPRCGDGTVNGAEQCDDGNRRNNDGCNVNCFFERDPE